MTPDDGPNHCNGAMLDAGAICPTKMLGSATVIGPMFSVMGSNIVYLSGADRWNVFAVADPGQTVPTITPSAGSIAVSAKIASTSGAGQGTVAVGAALDGASWSVIDSSASA